jgi:hypothetical protein
LAGLSDVWFGAPAAETSIAQEAHQIAYHIICDLVEEAMAGDPRHGS